MVAEKPSSSEISSSSSLCEFWCNWVAVSLSRWCGYWMLQHMQCTIEFKVTVCLFHSCKNSYVYAGQNQWKWTVCKEKVI